MKIRLVIVPPDRLNENRSIENAPDAPRLLLQEEPFHKTVSLRGLISRCNPMARRMGSWNDLDRLRSTAWICLKDGVNGGEWMWNGKDGICDPGDLPYHDFELTFEEVGEPPQDGLFQMRSLIGFGSELETALLPADRDFPLFENTGPAPGETKVHFKVFGRVPNEWEGNNIEPENEICISIDATSWFNGSFEEVLVCRASDGYPAHEQPYREVNELFLESLMDDQEGD